ncbi:hypothetical protein C7S16_1555 [Burkholderia thailandensis]|uniref:Uncharacterized protein n=1 Tax=Burkholderia thailandensis TaxID=57975 RepID=A0AAW9D6Q6_BURTH|nr:hypothetical protein [Burkholderia thailandensis]MDW9257661.1 hypothetical protein [Burkholderia thailandensis]
MRGHRWRGAARRIVFGAGIPAAAVKRSRRKRQAARGTRCGLSRAFEAG